VSCVQRMTGCPLDGYRGTDDSRILGDMIAPSLAKQPVTSTHPRSAKHSVIPGLLITFIGVVVAIIAHRYVEGLSVLTWSVLLGAVAANLSLLPAAAQPGLQLGTKKLLRVGVVLLGFSLPFASILALGLPVLLMVAGTLLATLVVTMWLGLRVGLGRPKSLLIATGFAICGASAIAAMEGNAEAEEDDVATAIAMVTIFGTIAMIALPLLQGPLGLSDGEFGIWSGASVHEVAQVVAAASPAGAAAVALAVVVKLTRVLLLAPVVAGVSVMRRRAASRDSVDRDLPPLVPLFVLGFLACVGIRSTGILPPGSLDVISDLQTWALSAALFGLGTGVRLGQLVRNGGRALAVGALSTVVVGCVSLAGVLLLV
jgi:uncharacterized integral membrane protein (TIGR00698 family)